MQITIEKMSLSHLAQINLADFDDFWSYNILKDELLSTSSYYIIAKCEDIITGFAGIKFLLDEAHITNIVTKKDMRNLGIGSKLLENLIEKAKENCSLITLEVNEKNRFAIALYKKYGFETLGTRKKYYDNKFDAYIMTKYFN